MKTPPYSPSPRLSSSETSASLFRIDDTNGRSRFSALRAPSLISRPRLEDGLWRPLRLDLFKIPLSSYRE